MAEIKSVSKHAHLERFTWGRDELSADGVTVQGDVYARLASDAIDVGAGISSVLAILESINLAKCDDETPLIGEADMFSLLRLAKYAARKLNDEGCAGLQWAYEHRTEVGRQEYRHARREAA